MSLISLYHNHPCTRRDSNPHSRLAIGLLGLRVDPRNVQPVGSCYTDWAIAAHNSHVKIHENVNTFPFWMFSSRSLSEGFFRKLSRLTGKFRPVLLASIFSSLPGILIGLSVFKMASFCLQAFSHLIDSTKQSEELIEMIRLMFSSCSSATVCEVWRFIILVCEHFSLSSITCCCPSRLYAQQCFRWHRCEKGHHLRHVRQFACISAAFAGRIFAKFDIGDVYENFAAKIQTFLQLWKKIIGHFLQ